MRRPAMLCALVLLGLSGCADRAPTPDNVPGMYRGEVPAPDGAVRLVRLRLNPGNAAEMAVTVGGDTVPVQSGTWSLNARGEIRVVLAEGGFGPVTSDIAYRWTRGTLNAIVFDTLRWGTRGFALARE